MAATAAVGNSTNVSLRMLHKRLLFPLAQHPHSLRLLPPSSAVGSCVTQRRCWANGSSDCSSGDPPPNKMAPLFPGTDYEHWIVLMGMHASVRRWMVRSYVETLAEVVGSEAEAVNRIYKVSCKGEYFGFGCEIDEETSNKLRDAPGVLTVIPDPEYSYCSENVGSKVSEIRERLNVLAGNVERLKKVTARNAARHYSKGATFYMFNVFRE